MHSLRRTPTMPTRDVVIEIVVGIALGLVLLAVALVIGTWLTT
jgi:hypothetical protein